MIRTQCSDGVRVLTLARPEKANALTAAMLEALIAGVDDAAAAQDRALILTGEGAVFSAGADLEAARAGLATSSLWEALSSRIARLPALTVAALNGTVAGGAMGMVLACDLRIAVPGTRFFYPVMKLGYLPQPSDPARLRALVGPARAAMILMANQRASTDEALAWGLIDRLSTPESLMPDAQELCSAAVAADPAHVGAISRMIRFL